MIARKRSKEEFGASITVGVYEKKICVYRYIYLLNGMCSLRQRERVREKR